MCLTVYLQACILVFDVTNKLSFDSLEYWLQEFTSNGGKQAVIAVVANKVRRVQHKLTGNTNSNYKTPTFPTSPKFHLVSSIG